MSTGYRQPQPFPGAQNPRACLAHVLGRKFPNIEEQSESPSIRLLEKKKEAKIMHLAMEQKKEVGMEGRKGPGAQRAWGQPSFMWVARAGSPA